MKINLLSRRYNDYLINELCLGIIILLYVVFVKQQHGQG